MPPDDAEQGLKKLDGLFSVKFLMLVNFDMKDQNFYSKCFYRHFDYLNQSINKWQGRALGARSGVRKNITHRKQTEKQKLKWPK